MEIVVVGAGVIGLSVAVCLAERGHQVEVRTDREPADTTSAVASAMVGPAIAPPDSAVGAWERASVQWFTALAAQPGTGTHPPARPAVAMRRGRLVSREPGPAPPGELPRCGDAELPPGYAVGFWATLPLVDMVPYLEYLGARLRAAGGRISRARVASLRELAGETALIVNCAGLGARELAGDDSVFPIFGQHAIVENPGVEEFFIEAPREGEWAGYWPHPDHVVIGGVTRPDDARSTPDLALAERMVRRCTEIEPRLAGARVLRHQAGLRPGRPSPRLDAERVGAARCVHCYGHGGSGVTHSWGAARAAAELLLDGSAVG